jgi:hypothetical protein
MGLAIKHQDIRTPVLPGRDILMNTKEHLADNIGKDQSSGAYHTLCGCARLALPICTLLIATQFHLLK